MYFLAVLTLASAALAVPFRLRRAGATDPAMPTVPGMSTGTAPAGTAATGGTYPLTVDTTSSYHVSITYATTSTVTPSTFITNPVHLQGTSAPSVPVSFQSFPTMDSSELTHTFTFTPHFPLLGTAPVPTGGSSGFPLPTPSTSVYSASVSYARTSPAYPVPT
ncbi:hypothetical protein F4677DRAFT_299566 [Hypoxylon crocopeplum]|nr:hypothetical protein F4677DRAFT_299566 [Hypoxylon crocopeplum]